MNARALEVQWVIVQGGVQCPDCRNVYPQPQSHPCFGAARVREVAAAPERVREVCAPPPVRAD